MMPKLSPPFNAGAGFFKNFEKDILTKQKRAYRIKTESRGKTKRKREKRKNKNLLTM